MPQGCPDAFWVSFFEFSKKPDREMIFFFHFQDHSVVWGTANPDFTECFKQTALIWIPCAFLLIFTPVDVYLRTKSRYSDIPWSFLNVSKFLVIATIILWTFIDMSMILYLQQDYQEVIYDVQIISASVKAVTFVSCLMSSNTPELLINYFIPRLLSRSFNSCTRKLAKCHQAYSSFSGSFWFFSQFHNFVQKFRKVTTNGQNFSSSTTSFTSR